MTFVMSQKYFLINYLGNFVTQNWLIAPNKILKKIIELKRNVEKRFVRGNGAVFAY